MKRGALVVLLLAVLLGATGVVRLNMFSKTISGRGALASEIGKRSEGEDRFNLVVLGYGGEGHEGACLTDSIVVYSLPTNGGRATQVSVPRDLWVQYPPDSGEYHKANEVYARARVATNDPRKAADSAAQKVAKVLGIPIHGWLTIDFNGFRDLVDALGGVRVDVQREFTARYPASDDASVSRDWITITFQKGRQRMDGETAIRYARARYSTNPAEGSDFARAARQQRLIAAIKDKLLSPAGVVRGVGVMEAVEDEVRSNLSASDLVRVFRSGVDEEKSFVISTENVLVNGKSDDGQSILLPKGGKYEVVHNFVRDSLDGRVTAER